MKKGILLCFYLFLFLGAYSQDQIQTSNFFAIQGLFNPAYNGTQSDVDANMVLRRQWTGIEGAPSFLAINVSSPIKKQGLELGVNIIQEGVGLRKSFEAYSSVGYKFQINEDITMSLALQLGINAFWFEFDKILAPDGGWENFDSETISYRKANWGMGAYAFSKDFYAGLSIPKFFNNYRGFEEYSSNASSVSSNDLQIYLYGGYFWRVSPTMVCKPVMLLRMLSGSSSVIDFGSFLTVKDKFTFGMTYRSSSSVIVNAEVLVYDKLTIGYSYDLDMAEIYNRSRGTQELRLGLRISRLQK